jgi:O-antigen/teichoic acid export membrane protein
MNTKGRLFATNLVWAFAGRGGVIIAGFGATVLLARLLSPQDVGIYYLILGIALAASPLANLSLDELTIREVAVGRGTGKQGRAVAFVRSSLRLASLGSLATAVLIVVIWGAYRWFDSGGPARWVVLAILASAWTAIYAMERQFVATLQGMEDIAAAALYDLALGRILSCIVLLILWLLTEHPTLIGILAVYISCEAVSLTGAASSAHRSIKSLGPPGVAVPWKEILATSWPFTVQVVITAVTNQAGIFILGATRSVKEVAIYSIAARLPALLQTPGTIVNLPLAPAIARLHAQNSKSELQNVLQAAATVPTAIAVIATVWWAFDGQHLLTMIFGAAYRDGADALLILSLSQCANLYFGPSMLTLSMGGEQSLAMRIGLIGAVGQIGAILLLVRSWGVDGVAVGVLISTVLLKACGWGAVRFRFGIWSHANIRTMIAYGRQVWLRMKCANASSEK